jgi:hypothetical protein
MRNNWLVLLVASLGYQGIAALTLHKRDVPAVVSLGIKRRDVADPVVRDRMRRKRDKTIGQSLDNEVCWRVLPNPRCSCLLAT